jgi:hypothetical protein
MGRDVLISDDDINKVKVNIRLFTFVSKSEKTLPIMSSSVNEKQQVGRLIDLYVTVNRSEWRDGGFHAITLRIKIGGIDFPVFKEDALVKIPILDVDIESDARGEIPMISYIYGKLIDKKKSGDLFTTNYFPYRRKQESIFNLPDTKPMFASGNREGARIRFYDELSLL